MKGRGIFDIEWLKQQGEAAGTSNRAIAVAFSALEQCLWDLQGKALGLPVYQLLGGALNRRIRT